MEYFPLPAIQVENLRVAYDGKVVIDGITLSIRAGTVTARKHNCLAYVPQALGASIFGLGGHDCHRLRKGETRIKEAAVIGVVFTGFFARGIVIISKTPSTVDINHILFGNVLGLLPADILQTVTIGSLTLASVIMSPTIRKYRNRFFS